MASTPRIVHAAAAAGATAEANANERDCRLSSSDAYCSVLCTSLLRTIALANEERTTREGCQKRKEHGHLPLAVAQLARTYSIVGSASRRRRSLLAQNHLRRCTY
jgi:hypothetical protein